jgi:hypothetical protein
MQLTMACWSEQKLLGDLKLLLPALQEARHLLIFVALTNWPSFAYTIVRFL